MASTLKALKERIPGWVIPAVFFCVTVGAFHLLSAPQLSWGALLRALQTNAVQEVQIWDDERVSVVLRDEADPAKFLSVGDAAQLGSRRSFFVQGELDGAMRQDLNARAAGELQLSWNYRSLGMSFLRWAVESWVFVMMLLVVGWRPITKLLRKLGVIARQRSNGSGESKKKTTFADVAGMREPIQALRGVVDALKDPERLVKLGARVPKGVLLHGPPGTGKTLLARALAGEVDAKFILVSVAELEGRFAGQGVAAVQRIFQKARRAGGPCVIFIDEIDGMGTRRPAEASGSYIRDRIATLNALLAQMDGFEPLENVVVVAATNRRNVIDEALLRPGRFDVQIYVGPPDREGREQILGLTAQRRNMPIDEDVDFAAMAQRCTGYTGAQLVGILDRAASKAVESGSHTITSSLLEQALVEARTGGISTSIVLDEDAKRRVAAHEAGHAIVAWFTEGSDRVDIVSILPSGESLGRVLTAPKAERYHLDLRDMLAQLQLCMGGRAGEVRAGGRPCSGASHDFAQATRLARLMVGRFGFSSTDSGESASGQVVVDEDGAFLPDVPESIRARILVQVDALLSNALCEAGKTIEAHERKFIALQHALVERETLTHDEIARLFERLPSADFKE